MANIYAEMAIDKMVKAAEEHDPYDKIFTFNDIPYVLLKPYNASHKAVFADRQMVPPYFCALPFFQHERDAKKEPAVAKAWKAMVLSVEREISLVVYARETPWYMVELAPIMKNWSVVPTLEYGFTIPASVVIQTPIPTLTATSKSTAPPLSTTQHPAPTSSPSRSTNPYQTASNNPGLYSLVAPFVITFHLIVQKAVLSATNYVRQHFLNLPPLQVLPLRIQYLLMLWELSVLSAAIIIINSFQQTISARNASQVVLPTWSDVEVGSYSNGSCLMVPQGCLPCAQGICESAPGVHGCGECLDVANIEVYQ
ncbi:hypothetical protein M409DRAFT_51340 [Zasmidium cellare ATCC 36951]|uniref:Uncharacterized protein n=1 Tax=Zasmidium cellare ATCC 36951 TaxID=1080233 RepID=A0A6A6CVR0_ZASCE|nr:uncharacterized protein M409DRAFT_51340 [Zasmidium cellare ATCC 36951]KAF2171125.1 hypothetical protein M409DRAFT_51340 [Zasmidium cellare ATCC 36951]